MAPITFFYPKRICRHEWFTSDNRLHFKHRYIILVPINQISPFSVLIPVYNYFDITTCPMHWNSDCERKQPVEIYRFVFLNCCFLVPIFYGILEQLFLSIKCMFFVFVLVNNDIGTQVPPIGHNPHLGNLGR